jgi:hypothetical protein
MVTHRITFKASVSQGAGSRVVSAHGQGPSPIHTFHTHTHTSSMWLHLGSGARGACVGPS